MFKPANKWCYQEVLVLPAIDEIELSADRLTLVVSEPHVGVGLNPQLKEFFDQATFKNRVAFLTGSRNTFDSLIDSAKRLKAIQHILDEMARDKVSESDPQFKQADELKDRILGQFFSAVKETFSTLYYPTRQGDKDVLLQADFLMKYEGNKYNGEDQIVQILRDKQKYTEDVTSDTFRKKVEARLFTTPVMLWSEIKKRAAMNTQWQWHRRDALDSLKAELVHKEVWREDAGGYVDRTPPPAKSTSVQVQERVRDDDTGRVELRVTPVHGDVVYAEIGGEATTASQKVDNGVYVTDEMEVSFIAVDSAGAHHTGPVEIWRNRVTMKHRLFAGSRGDRMLELRAAPNRNGQTEIRYTTDGSDPKLAGGTYESPIVVPHNSNLILAYARCDDVASDVLRIDIDWKKKPAEKPIDPERAATWKRRQEFQITMEAYAFLDRMKAHEAAASGVKVSVTGKRWGELTLQEQVRLSADELRDAAELLRRLLNEGQLGIEVAALHFEKGQRLLDWAHEAKIEIPSSEVQQ
jgi:hypothetical protein